MSQREWLLDQRCNFKAFLARLLPAPAQKESISREENSAELPNAETHRVKQLPASHQVSRLQSSSRENLAGITDKCTELLCMVTGDIFIPRYQKPLYLHILDFHPCASTGTANFYTHLQQSNASLCGTTSNQSSWLSFQHAHSLPARIPQKNQWQTRVRFARLLLLRTLSRQLPMAHVRAGLTPGALPALAGVSAPALG